MLMRPGRPLVLKIVGVDQAGLIQTTREPPNAQALPTVAVFQ
jgi:hypothetical protein